MISGYKKSPAMPLKCVKVRPDVDAASVNQGWS